LTTTTTTRSKIIRPSDRGVKADEIEGVRRSSGTAIQLHVKRRSRCVSRPPRLIPRPLQRPLFAASPLGNELLPPPHRAAVAILPPFSPSLLLPALHCLPSTRNSLDRHTFTLSAPQRKRKRRGRVREQTPVREKMRARSSRTPSASSLIEISFHPPPGSLSPRVARMIH